MAAPARAAWVLPTLSGYRAGWLGRDLVAGVSAGAVVIPQAMAYATIAELPVEVGLYTCITPMVAYALLGGSRAMSVSTTSTIATLTATTLVSAGVAASASPDAVAGDLATLTLLVGAILVLARVFRLGSLVENINEATLIGIKVGLGATVALGQVPKLLGVDVEPTGRGFVRTLAATVEAVPRLNVATVLLSLGSIAVLLVLGRVAPRVPAQLVIVVVGIVLVAFTPLAETGVRVIDPVPTGFPLPLLPGFGDAAALLPGALAIAVMAFLESASVARGIRQTDDPQVDSNRELLATGVANLVGAFFHTLPAAGGFSQSAVNQRAGARSQLASLVTAALAVLVALFLAPVLDDLPQATLAAMVFVAVTGLIDVRGLVRLARVSRLDFWIAVVTAAIGLAAGLLPAVAAGVLFTLGSAARAEQAASHRAGLGCRALDQARRAALHRERARRRTGDRGRGDAGRDRTRARRHGDQGHLGHGARRAGRPRPLARRPRRAPRGDGAGGRRARDGPPHRVVAAAGGRGAGAQVARCVRDSG